MGGFSEHRHGLILRKFLPATGIICALRAQRGKNSLKWVPGTSRSSTSGAEESKTESKKVKIVEQQSILTFFRLRVRHFGGFGAEGPRGPGTHFGFVFFQFGAEAPKWPLQQAHGIPTQPNKLFRGGWGSEFGAEFFALWTTAFPIAIRS